MIRWACNYLQSCADTERTSLRAALSGTCDIEVYLEYAVNNLAQCINPPFLSPAQRFHRLSCTLPSLVGRSFQHSLASLGRSQYALATIDGFDGRLGFIQRDKECYALFKDV